jgi:hypothetical protein
LESYPAPAPTTPAADGELVVTRHGPGTPTER